MKYKCPECEMLSDTIRIRKLYSSSEQWESWYDLDTTGKEEFTDREDLCEEDNGEGKLEDTEYFCPECDFETDNIKDFVVVQ